MPKRTRRKCELHEQKQADKKKKKKRGAGVWGKKQRGIGIIWDVLPLW